MPAHARDNAVHAAPAWISPVAPDGDIHGSLKERRESMAEAEEMFETIADALARRPGIARGKMFGKKCATVNGNGFLAFFNGDLVCKLSGSAHEAALGLEGATPWDPSGKGRPMKEWVQIPARHADRWQELAEAARACVAELPPK
jgi:hypothetical protein